MKCSQARLPIAPLLAQYEHNMSMLARALDVHHRQVVRWQHHGIPYYTADILAVRAGSHPANVWGLDWHQAGIEQTDLEAAHVDENADRRMRRWLSKRSAHKRAVRAELVGQYNRIERHQMRIVR